jgi:hypothetical protein
MADYNNNNVVERELDWEETIEDPGSDFVLLPEGEYEFTVDHFDRDRHNGSDKLPPCKKVILYLHVETPQGTAEVRESLFLHTKGERKLYSFFICIGQGEAGKPLTMRWANVPGARGRAKFGVREYNGKQYNEVKKFLEPAAPAAAPGGYQQPAGGYAQPGAYQPSGQYQQQPMAGYPQPGYTPSAPQQTGTYTPGKF